MIIIKDKENTSLIHLSNNTNVDDYIVQDLYALTIAELYRLLEELDAKIDTPSKPSEPDEPTGDVKLQNIKYAIIKKIMSTINPDRGFDGMKQVEIDATPLYNQGIEKGYQNGREDGIDEGYEQGKQDGIEEQKSKLSAISISQNGTYVNKDGYNKVTVDIETTPISIQDYKSVEISEINETITPDDGFDGVRTVGVNANQVYENGRIDGIEEQKSKLSAISITKNGTYTSNDGYNNIDVNIPSSGSDFNSEIDLVKLGYSQELSNEFNSYINEQVKSDIEYSTYCKQMSKWNYEYDTTITYVPYIDTSSVTSFYKCFCPCYLLKTIPLINTANAYSFSYMFSNCYSLLSVPKIITSKGSDFSYMFNNCRSLINAPLLDLTNASDIEGMYSFCTRLKTIPSYYPTKATNASRFAVQCLSLISIGLLDFGKVSDISFFFGGNQELTYLTDLGGFLNLKIDWNDSLGLTKCPNLTKQSVLNVINNLYDFRANGDSTTTRTIKFNSNSLALLSDDEKAIATAKGWVLTS